MSDELRSGVNCIGSLVSKSDELTKRLLELIDRCNYQLVQENGQRRLTSANLESRIKGAEIFLGRLPRDCYEDELVPLLSKVGRVVELRLMMDFSGSTRGYAFALFETQRIARIACEQLNGYEIRPGHRIGVVKSVDNCRLFLGGVPKDKTRADFVEELGKMLDGITNVYVYPSTEDSTRNRGFVFIEFRDHRSAAMARRKLIPGRVMLWNHEVAVDWADPEPGQDIDDEVMETVSALFVRNLPLNSTESEVRNGIQNLTGIPVMKIKKINHFAFLHYETRAQAELALDLMQHSPRNALTSEWELTWAKPIRKAQKLEERLRCANVKVENREARDCVSGRKNQGSKNRAKIVGRRFDEPRRSDASRGTPSTAGKIVKHFNNEATANGYNSSSEVSPSPTVTPPSENGSSSSVGYPCAADGFYFANYGGAAAFDSENQQNVSSAISYVDINGNDVDCARALEELAALKFNGNLRYEYSGDSARAQYFCKIILEREGSQLMNYHGNQAATIHEAFESTVRDAYFALRSMVTRGNL